MTYDSLVSLELFEAQAHDAEKRFSEDAAGHLARPQLTIDEDHWNFLYFEAEAEGGIFHLYLEGIALEVDVIQADGFQYLARPANKAGCSVAQGDAEDSTDVGRGIIRHEDAPDRPVHDVHARDVAAANGGIVALVVAGSIEARQVGRGVAEVGIHLEDILIALLQSPYEATDVCLAKSLLSRTLDKVDALQQTILLHETPHDFCRSVGTSIVNDEDVECLFQ